MQSLQATPGHPAVLPDLDPVRTKLAQAITAIVFLQDQLHYLSLNTPTPSTAQPGILPFPELLNRYTLLLTHLTALGNLLSSQAENEKERDRDREEGAAGTGAPRRRRKDERDARREKWDSLSVVPAVEVDEAKDWLVGMLLRTKQTPEVEASQTVLVSSLPAPFSSAVSSSDPAAFANAVAAQSRLLNTAYDKVCALKEFNSEGEEWDWKGRVELDEAERDADGEGEKMEIDEAAKKPEGKAWTPEEVAAYLRTGKKPVR
ncbi:hypothetical protein JCM21900_004333 [Sporobolomyces salmonicolor]